MAHMKTTSFLLHYLFHVLVHLNLKLSGKNSLHLFSIILVLGLELLKVLLPNIVIKDMRGSFLSFHDYALGSIFKVPTLP